MGLLIDGVWHEQEPAATRADTGTAVKPVNVSLVRSVIDARVPP